MEETVTTTVEAPQEQTTPEVTENQTIEEETQPEVTQESEEVEAEATETAEAVEPAKEPEKNWEQIAARNRFCRVKTRPINLQNKTKN